METNTLVVQFLSFSCSLALTSRNPGSATSTEQQPIQFHLPDFSCSKADTRVIKICQFSCCMYVHSDVIRAIVGRTPESLQRPEASDKHPVGRSVNSDYFLVMTQFLLTTNSDYWTDIGQNLLISWTGLNWILSECFGEQLKISLISPNVSLQCGYKNE